MHRVLAPMRMIRSCRRERAMALAFVLSMAACWPASASETILLRIQADGPGGSVRCDLRRAPTGTAARESGALAAAADAVHAQGLRLLSDAAAMRLSEAREAVPPFADWAYGWVQSYVTSYRILGRAVTELANSALHANEQGLTARLAEEMAEPLRSEFRIRVLGPVLAQDGIGADFAHVGWVVDQAWSRHIGQATARLAMLPRAPEGSAVDRRIDLAAAGAPLAPLLAAASPADMKDLIAEEGTDSSAAFLRSVRPLAARLGLVLVRISEVGSLMAASGAFGFALGGMAGTASGVVGGVGIAWGVDWMFNRVDAIVNRTAFEAQALEAIARAERRMVEGGDAVLRAALDERLARISSAGECR